MQVHVTFKGSLATLPTIDPAARDLDLPENADAATLLATCGLDRRGCIVIVNGAVASPGGSLREGDQVQVYPAQAGG